MRICWDNLEKIILLKNGYFRKGHALYFEDTSCIKCGDPYLNLKCRPSNFCGHSCSLTKENHPQFGKKFSEEWKRKLSVSAKLRYKHINNPNYKGGVDKKGIPLFDTFSERFKNIEETKPINKEDIKSLGVRCVYCDRWFVPSLLSVRCRLGALSRDPAGRTIGECRFYCSTTCKISCPTFRQRTFPKGFKTNSSREVQPDLRKLLFKRDNYECQICNINIDSAELHCHHLTGLKQNPLESADIDNCITLCKKHHQLVHSVKGCTYYELKCKGV